MYDDDDDGPDCVGNVIVGKRIQRSLISHTRTHVPHTHRFNSHFSDKPGLAGCPLDFPNKKFWCKVLWARRQPSETHLFCIHYDS